MRGPREIWRAHSWGAWLGISLGVSLFVLARTNDAPAIPATLILLAHVVAVLYLDDLRLDEGDL